MLPSKFGSFGQAVSEKKIQMWEVNRLLTPSNGKRSNELSDRRAKNRSLYDVLIFTQACILKYLDV
jgi:hypothetical protein